MLPFAKATSESVVSSDKLIFGLQPARWVVLLCLLVISNATLNLLGWWFHESRLVGFFPEAATMKPNTALCVLLLSFAMLFLGRRSHGGALGATLAYCTVAVTAVTLSEYALGRDFGIDQMLAKVPADLAGDPFGRMSVGTAVDGLLLGLALLLIDAAPPLATWLGGLTTLLSFSALVGFLFDVSPVLGVPLLRSMAVRTALSFAALGSAFFLLRPTREPLRSFLVSARHHRMNPWFILGTCTVPVLLGLPVAALYRHGFFEATFGFALLVVLLMAVQALLLVRNSQSLASVERARSIVELERLRLQEENDHQAESQKLIAKLVAQSDAQYRIITNALPALVSYIDAEYRYIRANSTYEIWFGRSSAEIEGRTVDEVLGGTAGLVRSHLVRALTGEVQIFETQMQTLQGERTVSISHIPDFDSERRVRGVIVQANDVTTKRREEISLRQTEKLAAVGKLASSIAHEINNPLESITNLIYLAKTSADAGEIQDYLVNAESEVRRVSAIASQTLRFHKQSTRPALTDAVPLLESVLQISTPRLGSHARLVQRHRPTTPLLCFEGEIRQVLNNLVGNALDAMQGKPGQILLRSHMATSWVSGRRGLVFTVSDNGTGMNAGTLATIFEAFFTTKGMNGTGLGLWVSKEIVDRHHGTLRVRSSQAPKHHGTVFRMFLPYEQEPTPSKQ